jgi:hypothetical protein
VRQLPYADEIFIRGHVELGEYVALDIVRPYDRIFTILRDPIDLAIPQVNYILTRLKGDAERGTLLPDTTKWLEVAGVELDLTDLTDDMFGRIGQTVLRDRAIVRPNTLCAWLGGGKTADVLHRLAEYKVEITNAREYSRWLHDRWSINTDTRRNESIKFFTRETLPADDLSYLHSIFEEDAKLYRAVEERLANTGLSSVALS